MNLVRRLSVCTSVVITSALTSVALASAAVTIPFQINPAPYGNPNGSFDAERQLRRAGGPLRSCSRRTTRHSDDHRGQGRPLGMPALVRSALAEPFDRGLRLRSSLGRSERSPGRGDRADRDRSSRCRRDVCGRIHHHPRCRIVLRAVAPELRIADAVGPKVLFTDPSSRLA